MRSTIDKTIRVAISLLLLTLVFLIFLVIRGVDNLQETERVVDYTELVRGETQRVIKLEVTGHQSPELIAELDGYLDCIQNGSTEPPLIKVEDSDFQAMVQNVSLNWAALKAELEQVRSEGYENTDIIALSEEHARLSDEMMEIVQASAQRITENNQRLEHVIALLAIVLLLLTIKQAVEAFMILHLNGELGERVFWDELTELPNKRKCEQILNQSERIREPTTVYIFDLSNLKYVKDNFGHEAGDKLVTGFASIIRTTVPEPHFVGRYGRDEIVAVLAGDACQNADEIAAAIQKKIEQFNQANPETPIRYVAGHASSADSQEDTLRGLYARADKDLFQNKKLNKKHTMALEEGLDASLTNMIQALGREYTDCCYCNAKTGGYHLFGGATGSNIPRNGKIRAGMIWLSALIADKAERASFLEKLSLPYIRANLDEKHTSFDVTCHFRGVARSWWKLTAVYVDSDEGQLYHFLLLFKEITDEKELEFEAKHDGLTGLWNKTAAFELMDEQMSKQKKQHNMMIFDLDNFKQVNDTMGHAVGDTVIKKTAEIIRGQFREVDIVARFGGDEFFVFVEDELSREALQTKADNIRKNTEAYFKKNLEKCDVTISIGVVVSHRHTTVTELFHKADEALYTAKRQGKNRSAFIVDGEKID